MGGFDHDGFDDNSGPELGPCCVCESTKDVYCILMLNVRSPSPGHGWGCVQCGLPNDGAIAVMCKRCAETFDADLTANPQHLRFVCNGEVAGHGRAPYSDLSLAIFDHDLTRHPEMNSDDLSIGNY